MLMCQAVPNTFTVKELLKLIVIIIQRIPRYALFECEFGSWFQWVK